MPCGCTLMMTVHLWLAVFAWMIGHVCKGRNHTGTPVFSAFRCWHSHSVFSGRSCVSLYLTLEPRLVGHSPSFSSFQPFIDLYSHVSRGSWRLRRTLDSWRLHDISTNSRGKRHRSCPRRGRHNSPRPTKSEGYGLPTTAPCTGRAIFTCIAFPDKLRSQQDDVPS